MKARIGGDVVVLDVAEPDQTAGGESSEGWACAPTAVNGTLRVEIGNGHRFIAEVVEAFPGEIQSVALHKPTLEDVFLDETGARIE